MNDLLKKYKTGKLTKTELLQLRLLHDAQSNAELERELLTEWSTTQNVSMLDDGDVKRIKRHIDNQIVCQTTFMGIARRVVRVAAAIFIPILLISTLYFYNESHRLSSKEIVFATGVGEKARVTLPDGTNVVLNSESKLTYQAADYNNKNRLLRFNGEGYFCVAKDPEHPFIVNGHGLRVQVFGTVFNLQVREHKLFAQLTLESGSVAMESQMTGERITVAPNQVVRLDQKTGGFEICSTNYIADSSSWSRGELSFHNQPLRVVVESIENSFGVIIVGIDEELLNDSVTGTISTFNINEAISMIEKSFHLYATFVGTQIRFSPQR